MKHCCLNCNNKECPNYIEIHGYDYPTGFNCKRWLNKQGFVKGKTSHEQAKERYKEIWKNLPNKKVIE